MISQIRGTLLHRELDRIEVMTAGGIAYECLIPLSVFEALPAEGGEVSFHTHLVVREDSWTLYAFQRTQDRSVFQQLLNAKGVGPALALGILSTLTPERVVRALTDKDVATLMRVPRVGRKKAEQIILDLADKAASFALPSSESPVASPTSDDAIRALAALGYPYGDAERAVRAVLSGGSSAGVGDVSQLVRAALGKLTGK